MPHLVCFRMQFQKDIVIFEINTLEFGENKSIANTDNFGMGSVFSKGRGPGSLYKVYRSVFY